MLKSLNLMKGNICVKLSKGNKIVFKTEKQRHKRHKNLSIFKRSFNGFVIDFDIYFLFVKHFFQIILISDVYSDY